MRFNDLPEQCKTCQNLKVWALDMGGNHGVTCKKGLPHKKMMIAKNVECEDYKAEEDNDTDCEYCHEDSDGYVFPLEKNGHALVKFGMDGWTLSVKYGTWRKNIRINYCPMCGRRLKHERLHQQTGCD